MNPNYKLLKVPYYTYEFLDIPKNPFSIILFCYLGEINKSLYDSYLQLFKQTLILVDPQSTGELIFNNKPHIRFPLNKKYSENSYLFTLTNGEFQDFFDSDVDLFEEISTMIEEENPENFGVYYFLADFFKLSLKFYSSLDTLFKPDEEVGMFGNNNSAKEVFFYLNDDQIPFPILNQESDGVIRLKSYLLKTHLL